jgi:hypothetical protein
MKVKESGIGLHSTCVGVASMERTTFWHPASGCERNRSLTCGAAFLLKSSMPRMIRGNFRLLHLEHSSCNLTSSQRTPKYSEHVSQRRTSQKRRAGVKVSDCNLLYPEPANFSNIPSYPMSPKPKQPRSKNANESSAL